MTGLLRQLRQAWKLRRTVRDAELDFLVSVRERENELLKKLKAAQEGHVKLLEATALTNLRMAAHVLENERLKAETMRQVRARVEGLTLERARSEAETKEHEKFCKEVLGLDSNAAANSPHSRALAEEVLRLMQEPAGGVGGGAPPGDAKENVALEAARMAARKVAGEREGGKQDA